MKTKFNLQKNAVRFISVIALIASGMFMLASCSKEEISGPAASTATDQHAMRTDVPAITMKQTNCAALNCAEFDFQVYVDGWVYYNGYAHVNKTGHIEFQVDKSVVASLTQFANDQGFFKLRNAYPLNDQNAAVYTFARFKQLKKTVEDHGEGIPENLKIIKQTFLDKLGITPLIEMPVSAETPVISLKHDGAAAGFPEYNVSLFADGRMVYDGLSGVQVLGKVEISFPKDIVAELVVFARDNGFLDMKDEYPFAPDSPGTQTTILIDDILKTVVDYSVDIPENLVIIKGTIEDKLKIRDLTGI